jgi:hypothetical protein
VKKSKAPRKTKPTGKATRPKRKTQSAATKRKPIMRHSREG